MLFLPRIAHDRYVKIVTGLRGFRVKNANFPISLCMLIPTRHLVQRKQKPTTELNQKAVESC